MNNHKNGPTERERIMETNEKIETGKALANAVLDQAADGLDRIDYILGLASTLLEPTEIDIINPAGYYGEKLPSFPNA